MPQNGPEYSHRNPGFSGNHDDRKHRGLLSWLVSLSSSVAELTMGLGERLLAGEVGGGGGGCCKSMVLSVSLALGDSVHSSCLP